MHCGSGRGSTEISIILQSINQSIDQINQFKLSIKSFNHQSNQSINQINHQTWPSVPTSPFSPAAPLPPCIPGVPGRPTLPASPFKICMLWVILLLWIIVNTTHPGTNRTQLAIFARSTGNTLRTALTSVAL